MFNKTKAVLKWTSIFLETYMSLNVWNVVKIPAKIFNFLKEMLEKAHVCTESLQTNQMCAAKTALLKRKSFWILWGNQRLHINYSVVFAFAL